MEEGEEGEEDAEDSEGETRFRPVRAEIGEKQFVQVWVHQSTVVRARERPE